MNAINLLSEFLGQELRESAKARIQWWRKTQQRNKSAAVFTHVLLQKYTRTRTLITLLWYSEFEALTAPQPTPSMTMNNP